MSIIILKTYVISKRSTDKKGSEIRRRLSSDAVVERVASGVDAKLMPGINSRPVFINQNRDRVKNPSGMYAFSALRLRRMQNKQRDKHYEVSAVEASSVINAHPIHTRAYRQTRT